MNRVAREPCRRSDPKRVAAVRRRLVMATTPVVPPAPALFLDQELLAEARRKPLGERLRASTSVFAAGRERDQHGDGLGGPRVLGKTRRAAQCDDSKGNC